MGNKLPKNWVNVSLQDVSKNVKGKKPKIQSEIEFEGSVPYMDIKALEYNVIRQFADIESSKLFGEGDVAMVWDGARSGWVSKTNFGAIGSTLVAFKPITINSNYLFYYLLDKYPFINSNARGVGIPHVDPTVLWALKFPLPPLAEQNRIVEKLDRLFTQLEILKTSMAKVPLLLKDFRQQVLTQAVTGKLTEEWRNKKELGKWENVSSSKLFEFVTSGSRGWAQYYNQDGKQLFVRITNMNYGTSILDLNQDKLQFLKLPNSSEGKRTLLQARDILISITADIGMISLIPENFPYEAYVNQHVCLARPVKTINEQFLVNYLMSEKGFGQLKDRKKGATKAGLNLSDIKDLNIEIPTIEEQQEIVNRVESMFPKADAIEQQYKSLKSKIDTLPQAILHKAFKGELSEQLDSDGDARELLKQIQELKNSAVKPKKVTTKKVKNYPEGDGALGMVAEE